MTTTGIEKIEAPSNGCDSRYVIGGRVDATTYEHASDYVVSLAKQKIPSYVLIAGVNILIEGHDKRELQKIVNHSHLSTPDGMPLVWALKLLGVKHAERVTGPYLTPYILRKAAKEGLKIGFYGGSSDEFLQTLVKIVEEQNPGIEVVYKFSPPFRPPTEEEDAQVRKDILDSGAQILFVGIGCPKQEKWVWAHWEQFPGVMLGVGAAFDFIAGIKPMAPMWMQNMGLEWLFRLACEPKRLWRRYVKQNPRFMGLFTMQLLRLRRFTPTE